MSLDIDVLDPAYAPGTGTPEPAGLTTRELFPLLRRLGHEIGLVGAEVVEVRPAHDPGYTTALNGHRAIMEMITGMAMRKQGSAGVTISMSGPGATGRASRPIGRLSAA